IKINVDKIAPLIKQNPRYTTREILSTIAEHHCKNLLREFKDTEEVKMHVSEFFNKKSEKFYGEEINKLLNKWEKVIEQNGAFIADQAYFI
ncbi:hypothetical protein WH47_07463, partial [Habropoda laboriosa]